YTILQHVFIDKLREAYADKCDVRREQEALGESSARLEKYLEAKGSSPSERAEKAEQLLRLAEAMERPLHDERDAVIKHYLLKLKPGEIASQLPPTKNGRRTKKAVAGLLARGLHKLRVYLKDSE